MNLRTLLVPFLAAAVLVPATTATAQATRTPDDATCPALDPAQLKAPSVFRYGLSAGTLQSDFFADGGLKDSGYRPVRLAGYQDGAGVEYATRWVQTGGPKWRARFGLTSAQFHAEYLAYKDTYRMTDVSGFNTPAGVRYNVVWELNTAGLGWRIHRDSTLDQMDDLVDQYKSDGFAPLRVEGYRTSQGDLRFISVWVAAKKCAWEMEHRMSHDEYKDVFDDYAAAGHRQVHVDATIEGSTMRYHAIWWKQPGPAWQVRVDRDWYLYQQFLNNNWCSGFELTNFYGADNAGAARFGGIWTYEAPVAVDDGSSLSDRVRAEVNCAPARGGAAVINLTTGEEILHHADQRFGPSSTTKSAILLSVLRKAENEGTSLQTLLDLPAQLGSNQGPDKGGPENGPLQVGNDETIEYLARIMIDNSNNWATNRLINYVGMNAINDDLEDVLGLQVTRLNRYMTGAGAPSAHGLGGPTDDYEAGYDNVTTPREFATFLRLAHENPDGLLGDDAYEKFWEIMRLNNADDDAILDAGVGSDWGDSFAKAGSNAWGWDKSTTPWTETGAVGDYTARPQAGAHLQRSEAGRLVFDNGQVVVYAAFFNEGEDLATYQPFDDALDCIVVEVVREYSGLTTGAALPQCQ